MQKSQHSNPLVIRGGDQSLGAEALTRLPFDSSSKKNMPEEWIQDLIHRYPELLPIDEIEPALTPLVSICEELPTPAGPLDNLMMTPDGGIVLVECKLWRNPESRRKVIAQVLDYARGLAGWNYEDLAAAVRRAKDMGETSPSIWQRLAGQSELDEAGFVDAVTRNLRLGRFLCLIVGDGIRESAEELTEFVQGYAGIHSTMALVELSIWHGADDDLIVIPRIPLRTVTIERGVVDIASDQVIVRPPAGDAAPAPTTLSEEIFFERLAESDPSVPSHLKEFISRVEPLGVSYKMKKTLILRWQAPSGEAFNLGYVQTDGSAWFDIIYGQARSSGLARFAASYLEAIAESIGGRVQKEKDWSLKVGRSAPRISDLLRRQDAWFAAIENFTNSMAKALHSRTP